MSVHIVRLGSARGSTEGLRIGTVRRPPRGVKREDYAAGNWYDVWLPLLAPSAESASDWARFARRYRAEMARPEARRTLDLLAALSHQTNFAVGCYCADAARCHRSLLGALLAECGAELATIAES